MELTKPGTYMIYYEHRAKLEGRIIQTSRDIPSLHFVLRSADGTNLTSTLRSPRLTHTYNRQATEGESIFAFDIETPGLYTLEVSGDAEPASYVIAIERVNYSPLFLILSASCCGGVLAVAMGIAGIVVLIVAWVRKR